MTKKEMTHASVFSGIGGAEVAATMLGWENLFHCEINPFGRRVLEYWYPKSKSYEDITKTNFSEWRGKVSVLSGGFPCQPFSVAGQRRGKDDDRYLWPHMLRVIDEVQPDWFVGENVVGILSMVEQGEVVGVEDEATLFGEVDNVRRYRQRSTFTIERICRDLEGHGYSVQAFVIPACAVGAPHRRDRVFIVGHRDSTDTDCERRHRGSAQDGRRGETEGGEGLQAILRKPQGLGMGKPTPHTDDHGLQHHVGPGCEGAMSQETASGGQMPTGQVGGTATNGGGWSLADTEGDGKAKDGARISLDTERKRWNKWGDDDGNAHETQQTECGELQPCGADCAHGVRWLSTDTALKGLEGDASQRVEGDERRCEPIGDSIPITPRCGGEDDVAGGGMWDSFPTQSPVHRGNDGISFDVGRLSISFGKWRTESLKAFGNAIVPEAIYEIYRAIEIVENEKDKD